MILLAGCYLPNIKVDTLRSATIDKTLYTALGTKSEANNWDAKVCVDGRKFLLQRAVGVLSDRFGFWYILDFKLTRNNLSFLITNENSGERHRFELVRMKGEHEFWGTTHSLHLIPVKQRIVSCLALETPEITPSMTGIPERMLQPPPPSSLH